MKSIYRHLRSGDLFALETTDQGDIISSAGLLLTKDIDPEKLKNLSLLPIVVYEKSGKRSEKKIFKLEYFQESENELTLLIDVEGGLPIKRFVNGDDVNPSIANTLETPCKCAEFDILDVVLQ